MSRPHILIVGGAGVFGSRLARLLARRKGFRVSLGGRTESRARALQRELRALDEQGEYGFVLIDRDRIGVERLKEIDCDVVVDCSGPFQLSGTQLIEAAIGARCHYVDIAD
ncbi:MAG: saccharopine dehydrogenase NADP-binding domain-containing protein, partial [Devosia sp.]|nr:saccharopine dehydrogenase NADP-binding domain-containing protein [Devosia sp.]